MNYWQAILKQTTDREFMTRLWRLALPVSLQSMMFSLLGLIDIMMVSQLGTTAVAAVGLGNRVFFFNLLVIAGLAGGVSVLSAQYFGRGELAGVRRSLVAADHIVIPHPGEAGQKDARLTEQGQPFTPQHPLFTARGDLQTLADKWHNTSTG